MRLDLVKYLILFCALLLNSSAAKCQNLVPNPSFEDTVSCPTTANQLNNCAFWSVVSESPDYFHECAFITGNTSVPYNFAGFQYPATGSAYAGLVTYTEVGSNIREIIICELISPLVVGQKYFGSLKVSRSGAIANLAANKIGMLFSKQLYSPATAFPINNFSHIFSNMIITDSINWTTISGSFVADSNYQYLLLGNFFDDSNTDTIQNPPFNSIAYYYIDDVIVTPDTLNNYNELINNYGLSVSPNPCHDYLNISMKNTYISSIELYDFRSKLIKIITNINNSKVELNLDGLSPGIYLGKIITGSKIINIKILKI